MKRSKRTEKKYYATEAADIITGVYDPLSLDEMWDINEENEPTDINVNNVNNSHSANDVYNSDSENNVNNN